MTEPILSIQGLSRHFGGVHAVDNINLDVLEYETMALIGPNGAGKTTFYNMLSGRLRPSAGKILYRGRDIAGRPPHYITRLGISRSFQINNIFTDFSVRQNVEVALTALQRKAFHLFHFASRDRKLHQEADAVLERLNLAEYANTRAGILSYGDKRLLEMAIVLATRPRVVLLDEPTAGMTPQETHRIIDLIGELAAGREYTFLITEHDMNVVFNLSDRICVLHRGQLLTSGTPEQIRANPEVRQAYLGEEDTP